MSTYPTECPKCHADLTVEGNVTEVQETYYTGKVNAAGEIECGREDTLGDNVRAFCNQCGEFYLYGTDPADEPDAAQPQAPAESAGLDERAARITAAYTAIMRLSEDAYEDSAEAQHLPVRSMAAHLDILARCSAEIITDENAKRYARAALEDYAVSLAGGDYARAWRAALNTVDRFAEARDHATTEER